MSTFYGIKEKETKQACMDKTSLWGNEKNVEFCEGSESHPVPVQWLPILPNKKKNLTSTVSKILSGPVCLKHSLWHFSTLATITLVNCTAHILATWKCPLARRLQGLAKNILNTKLSPFAPWWNVFCLYFCSFFSFTFQKAGCKWSLNSNVFFIICSKD